ncbi:MAG: vitamin K epoxide reductase family protein [Candidatus Limnocylindrales bacterium]
MSASRGGALVSALATIGLLIAVYLAWTRLAGGLPVCGPLHGCETVALSSYSEIFGLPVADLGVGFSVVLLGLALIWWRRGDRRALLGLYGLGLIGVLFVVYLTYLELFVIHAVCVWCAGYGITIVVGWLLATVTLRRSPSA